MNYKVFWSKRRVSNELFFLLKLDVIGTYIISIFAVKLNETECIIK